MPSETTTTTNITGWARTWPAARVLARPAPRAGAWYAVVGETTNDRLVVQVADRRVAIGKKYLEVRDQRPTRFSAVIRPVNVPVARRGSSVSMGRVYAVCPNCCARFGVSGEPPKVRCPKCRHWDEVAWWESA